MTRREIRETVFKILFSLEFNDISEIREEAELELEHASLYDEDDNKMDAVAMTEEEKAYVIDRVEAVVAHITEIDETISGISQGWKLGRIGKAELAILRLAVYEIKYDEAAELKKQQTRKKNRLEKLRTSWKISQSYNMQCRNTGQE